MGVKLWMVFEAVSVEKEATEKSLKDHLEKLRDEPGLEILEEEVSETSKVEDPHPDLDEGYSKIVELKLETKNMRQAIEIVINYGPTYVQVEGPEKIEMDLKQAQETLQEVTNTMHQYAQMGAGGVIVSEPQE